jgi:hypothetical protein
MRAHLSVFGLLVVMLAAGACSGSGSGATTAPSAAAAGAARTISGQISYGGSALGSHKIVVVVVRAGEAAPAYSTVVAKPGAYSIGNVSDASYTVMAFIDLGDDMGAPKADEPQGSFDAGGDGTPDPVVIQNGNAATNVNITLRDR